MGLQSPVRTRKTHTLGAGHEGERKCDCGPPQPACAILQFLTHRGSLALLLRAGDVSRMKLPANMKHLGLFATRVTGACEEDPHPRVPVAREKVQTRRTSGTFLQLANRCLCLFGREQGMSPKWT